MSYFREIRFNRTKFILLWIASVILLSICATALGYCSGQFLLSYDAKIVRFYACNSPTASPLPTLESLPRFPQTEPAIYVCGLLQGTTFRRVAFYWYLNNKYIYNVLDEKVELGSFSRLLPPQQKNGGYIPGLYQVDAYSGRMKIASTKFIVQ